LIGSFIGIIVSNTVSGNIRIQVASDKVIIFFAKHSNIGPLVVARDIIKNIEKVSQAISRSGSKKEVFSEKKSFLTRFLSILLLLVNQFSIVLCYDEDFNDKMIACLADLVQTELRLRSQHQESSFPNTSSMPFNRCPNVNSVYQ